ncbi:ChbG/HpnK family deacetylase [candidate division WS5 bacterium]|uniref:ChbG/HpnK family deacetylase n=1 Tax=candidate division WS5 bacterium TaxID=2093353 RepID=A0A419DDU3_9BACT|nr:MAG: ChbG/HpnK family deacetylase [candidate division WS5 bacterium]
MSCKIVADDYGMSLEINQAISELVKKNILSKVSVMANESVGYYMNDINNNIEIGLHINLVSNPEIVKTTQNKKKTSLLKLLYILYTGQLNFKNILDGINQQCKILESRGFKISYLDSHQHVHIVPRILNAVIAYARTKGIGTIRCITMEKKYLIYYFYSLMRFGFLKQIPKMILLYFMGIVMKMKFDRTGINYSRNLILMPLATGGDYGGLLKDLLNKFKDKDTEIIVHPGLETEGNNGDGYMGRYIEYLSILQHERERA